MTVLDFIGAQRREFRFASRFRALSTKPTAKLNREIEQEFPHLPSGCVIRIERVAQKRILENVKESIRLVRPRMIGGIRDLARYLGRVPTLDDVIDFFDTTLDELLKRGLWSRLLADAGLVESVQAPDEQRLARGLRRLCHIDCERSIRRCLQFLRDGVMPSASEERRLHEMLHVDLWGDEARDWSIEEADAKLHENPSVLNDLQAVLEYRLRHSPVHQTDWMPEKSGPLTVHSQYTRDEILVGLGHWSLGHRPDQREGVLHLQGSKVDAFFVTLQKTEEEYSPTTMYEDYLISHDRFHWQSQSNTSAESPTGQRYINHRSMGYTPLLFVRESKKLPSGLSAPYFFLGPCEHVSHSGSRPISIIWNLLNPVPARLFRMMAPQNVA